nr:protein ALP1-like [Coffea arabica]
MAANNRRTARGRRKQIAEKDERDETMLVLAAELMMLHRDRARDKIPHHDGSLTGRQWVEQVINGHYRRSMENMRITVDNFLRLCEILQNNGYVSRSYQQRVEIEEALAMTLVMGAVGALDGTHIPACQPNREQMAYTNRHGIHSQNVLAVCDFDMRFNYVYAGWEGSAHDARVLESALMPPSDFPIPPAGKYYLVDAAYRNTPGFLPPYKNVQQRDPAKRLFNTRHSSLRNVIERTFGVLKTRFKFLKGPVPNFYMTTQISVVIACCGLHNFLRMFQPGDAHFQRFENENIQLEVQSDFGERVHMQTPNAFRAEIETWKATRDAMADQMYAAQGRRRR